MKAMGIMKSILVLSALLASSVVFAQVPVELHINHKLGATNDFAFNEVASNNLGQSFKVTRLQYYISGISITHSGGAVRSVPGHYILANGGTPVVDALGTLNVSDVTAVSFYIGVDEANNHIDPSVRPAGHPLELQTPNMHWGWASGYRFAAIEGKSGAGVDQTFEVHSLGDQHYYKTTVPVTGVTVDGKLIIALNADYVNALRSIDISGGVVAHGSGTVEGRMLRNFRDFVFSAGSPITSVNIGDVDASSNTLNVYPNPVRGGLVYLSTGTNKQQATIHVSDIQGKTITTLHTNQDGLAVLALQVKGLYLIKVMQANGVITVRKLLVE